MMKTIAAMGLAAAATAAPVDEVRMQADFVAFMKTHKKEYASDEVFGRYNVFKNNVARINHHNSQKLGWTMAVNEFADLTQDEFKATYYGYKPRANDYARSQNVADLSDVKVQDGSLDWNAKGAVTPVKNQGQCGSCWSFSTTGGMEGAHQIKTGNLVSFSEQQLVDCAGSSGNQGCNGGLMDDAFEWIIQNGGLCTESSYPYTARDGICKKSCSTAGTISSYKDVAKGQESALTPAVNIGPVSIAIEADQSSFQFYSGGVMDGTCGQNLDHGVLLAGYGSDGGKDYWLVKNSWGSSWGEKGYIRLKRGVKMCGVGGTIVHMKCAKASGTTSATQATTATTAAPTTAASTDASCTDLYTNCPQIAENLCYMVKTDCCKSCGLGKGMTPAKSNTCYDEYQNCSELCDYVPNSCKKSCNKC